MPSEEEVLLRCRAVRWLKRNGAALNGDALEAAVERIATEETADTE